MKYMRTVRKAAVRWVAVFAGATIGSYSGRLAAAMLYGEPVSPLLQVGPRTVLEQDVAPGFLAAEVIGRGFGFGLAGEAFVAGLAAGVSAVAAGPLIADDQRPPEGSRAPRAVIAEGAGR